MSEKSMFHSFTPKSLCLKKDTRNHLKNRILVQGQGKAEFQPTGILKYVEDLKREPNADIGPKGIFEIASKHFMLEIQYSNLL